MLKGKNVAEWMNFSYATLFIPYRKDKPCLMIFNIEVVPYEMLLVTSEKVSINIMQKTLKFGCNSSIIWNADDLKFTNCQLAALSFKWTICRGQIYVNVRLLEVHCSTEFSAGDTTPNWIHCFHNEYFSLRWYAI